MVDNCSCIIDTSTVHGGLIPAVHDCTDAGGRVKQEPEPRKSGAASQRDLNVKKTFESSVSKDVPNLLF